MVQITEDEEERVRELHLKVPLINASDTTSVVANTGFHRSINVARYVEKLKNGRVTIAHLSFVSWPYDNFYQAAKTLYKLHRAIKQFRDDVSLINSYDDVEKVIEKNKIGWIIHFHNTSMFDDDLGLLLILKKLGLRVMQLTYQGRNSVGDGCGEAPETSCGLSSFGHRVVEEMNKLHILIDLAHSSPKTFMDALEFSKEPVIYSHGCAQALCDQPRGRHLSDEQIHSLAEKDGVLGIMAKHLNPPLDSSGKIQAMTINDYMTHLEYVVDLVGVDHVGIGTENGEDKSIEDVTSLSKEFEARYYKPELSGVHPETLHKSFLEGTATLENHKKRYAAKGTETVLTLKKNLLTELVSRGYSDQEIAKILNGNFLRIYKRVW